MYLIMKEVRIPLVEGIYGRLEGISSILAVDLDKVINVSLLAGFKRYWDPICKVVSEFPEWDLPKQDKNLKVQKIWNYLAQQLETDFKNLKEIEVIEDDFDEIYPDEEFKNPLEKHKEFLKFLNSLD